MSRAEMRAAATKATARRWSPSRRSTLSATLHGTRILFFLTLALFAANVVGQDATSVASPSPTPGRGVEGTGSEKSLGSHANIVDISIALASLLGCIIIIAPYLLKKQSRKLRHALIVGLATSDLISALTIIASTSYLLNGGNLIEASRFCTFLGFALSSATYTQHFWNLCILVITYMILVHPLSGFTMTIERRVLWLWPIIWILAFAINGFAWGFAGFGYSGGYCYLGKGAGMDFVYLFPLVPRCIVVAITLVLYTRLFFFLRRTNLLNKTGSTRSGSIARSIASERRDTPPRIGEYKGSDETKREDNSSSESHRNKFYLPFLRLNGAASTRAGSDTSHGRSPTSPFKSRKHSGPSPTLLPIEMSNYAMTGPAPLSAPLPSGRSPRDVGTPSIEPPLSPKSTGPAGQPQGDPFDRMPAPYLTAGVGSDSTAPPRRSRSLSEVHRRRSDGGAESTTAAVEPSTPSVASLQRTNTGTSGSRDPLCKDERISSDADEEEDEIPNYNTWAGLSPMKPRRDTRDFNMVTAPREHLRHYAIKGGASKAAGRRPSTAPTLQRAPSTPTTPTLSLTPEHAPLAVVGGQTNSPSSSRRPSAPSEVAIAIPAEHAQAPPSRGTAAAYETAMGDDWTWGMDVTRAGGGSGGGGRRGSMLPSQLRTSSKDRRSTLKTGGAGGAAAGVASRSPSNANAVGLSSHASSSTDEHGVENMGSTLNRQASALLLLYPLAYIILFSISLARLIRDLVSTEHRTTSQDTLNNVARWLILAQGALDCIIFKLIEQQFRARMKRKRARARGEDPGTTSTQKAWTWTIHGAKRMLQGGTAARERSKEEDLDFRRPSGGV
ncbi:hypothetical protein BDZ90DRAFT_229866 [Jaminaea rosea]|uniref:G-protein coupled receptors family 1 profile domain-containing protein n=1 Tax=Jaminaea rosea TaxID=1569628 RepID=A0A316V009_9BASI|nr:hypothetical protein BDZ90DRAFT_229866 [Jaminaea rosea]PWN30876.1 hypothetical protein BDZ90DRAFT_229866 [Jaminaea rosea]